MQKTLMIRKRMDSILSACLSSLALFLSHAVHFIFMHRTQTKLLSLNLGVPFGWAGIPHTWRY